jgi:hypothetical protein
MFLTARKAIKTIAQRQITWSVMMKASADRLFRGESDCDDSCVGRSSGFKLTAISIDAPLVPRFQKYRKLVLSVY